MALYPLIRIYQPSHFPLLPKAASESSRRGLSGCSIVLHEGLYINPTGPLGQKGLQALFWSPRFSLEIVGLAEVRILKMGTLPFLFSVCHMFLTVKNVTVYGRNETSESILHTISSTVSLVDVRMHGSHYSALLVQPGTYLKAVNCFFSEFIKPFEIMQSHVLFESCRWFYKDRCGDFDAMWRISSGQYA